MADILPILRDLNMNQIRRLSDIDFLSWKALNSRMELEDVVSKLSPSQKLVLYHRLLALTDELSRERLHSSQLKENQKHARREETFKQSRLKRHKKLEGESNIHTFPDVVEDAVQLERLNLFNEHLSDSHTRQSVCGSCAGKYDEIETKRFCVRDIPNRHCLRPTHARNEHVLTEDLLLYSDSFTRHPDGMPMVHLCVSCFTSLQDNHTPKTSLANNMWIGDVPLELDILTTPERLLISLYFPSAFIVKLFPKSPGARYWKDWDVNFGLRGNVSTYRLDMAGIREMVKGNFMPHPPEILASVFSITLVGPNGKPERAIHGLCQVRRKRVLDALLWLKRHNPLYHDIIIDDATLARLPHSDVPDSITHNIKHVNANIHPAEADCYMSLGETFEDDDIQDVTVEDNVSDDDDLPACAEEGELCRKDPTVIALDESAVVDVDGFDLPESALLREALNNATENTNERREPAYAILRGNDFVNEYPRKDEFGNNVSFIDNSVNHLLGAFPCLFPYGCGGFETERPAHVSYIEHAQWALRYADGRFSRNIMFISQVFNVIQKRQVCLGAELQIRRRDYQLHEKSINNITVTGLKRAVVEETNGNPPSDPAIRTLKSFVKATRKHVSGTDENRMANRSKIHGMTLIQNPPNIWMSITCDDINDPLVQIFSGIPISLDNFDPSFGPDAKERLRNSTGNPYATTKFFFKMVKLVLEDLLGIKVLRRGKIERERGILGVINGYVGLIEAQGRGTLHLHILLWLQGSPSSTETVELLKDTNFRQHLEHFIQKNIKAHVQGLNSEYIAHEPTQDKNIHKQRASAYSRPFQPILSNSDETRRELEFSLVRTVQLHKCRTGSCLIPDKYGRVRCKRRAPWDLSPRAIVYESGLWYPEREYGFLNSWHPIILFATRSNSDIKLLTNANDTRHVTFYTTKYATKPQAKSYHATALLASRMAYISNRTNDDNDIRKKNKKLLSQCAHTLSRSQELSSQQMVAYIMGFGDRVLSHRFVPIYLSGALWILENYFAEFHTRYKISITSHGSDTVDEATTENGTDLHNMTPNGFQIKSQLADYAWRGLPLENFSFLEFLLESYEPHNFHFNDDTYRHERVPYLPQSPFHNDRHRILRHSDAEMMPDFLGSWVPRNDRDEEYDFYCACILLLLKPWRQLTDLKSGFDSWRTAFETFMHSTSNRNRRIIDNFQFYYRSADTAAQKAQDEAQHFASHEQTTFDSESHSFQEMLQIPGISYDNNDTITLDLDIVAQETESSREAYYGLEALNIAEDVNFFKQSIDNWNVYPSNVSKSSMGLLTKNLHWQECLEKITKDKEYLSYSTPSNTSSSVILADNVQADSHAISSISTLHTRHESEDDIPNTFFDALTADQRRACNIIRRHLISHLSHIDQNPLFMTICGSGGVGKSTVIKTIQQMFDHKKVPHLLSLTATSGVAASHINGQTVHWWAGLPIGTPKMTSFVEKSSPNIKKRRDDNIKNGRYLIIDEVSMLCQETLGVLSHIIQHHSPNSDCTIPFGGQYSIILIGDFHQFPPVARSHLALFKQQAGKSLWASIGFDVFQHFQTVVLLTEQKRVIDKTWSNILERIRYGACSADDIREIQRLVLTEDTRELPNFNVEPWINAILITPRHGVRTRWNDASVKKYARLNNKQLLISPAQHTFRNGQKLDSHTNADILLAIAKSNKEVSKILPRKVYLAVGLRILLTLNIRVNADLANGTIGTITDIFLDPREPPVPSNSAIYELQYPPKLIFFRPDHSELPALPQLPQGIIPIQPSDNKINVRLPNGSSASLTRTQFPATPAYSFTDYKSQGQTISPVILDLRKPPSGKLSQFNLYVALSRGVSREMTRILTTPDNDLFTTPPEEDLLIFDNILKKLNDTSK